MQAHKNALFLGITTAAIIAPALPAAAQADLPVLEKVSAKVTKPAAQKPHVWAADIDASTARESETLVEVVPEAIAVVYRTSDSSAEPSPELLAEATSSEGPADIPVVEDVLDLEDDATGSSAVAQSGVEFGTPEEAPETEPETEAIAEEADLESVSDFQDEDPTTDADIPATDLPDTEASPDDPLSQPLEIEGEADGAPLVDSDPAVERGEETLPEDGLTEDEPSALVQDVLEALRAPANPLFFPTNPETLEVTENIPVTLEQALQVAYRNSRDLQTAQLQLEQAQAALREAQAQRFPTLSATTSYSRSTVNTFNDGGTSVVGGVVTGGGNFTDTDSTLSGTVSLDYNLFTAGARRASIRAAREARQLQALQIEVVAEEIQLNITQAYYDIQEADETVRISRDNLNEALISFRDAEARERAGVGTRFDRLQAQVEVANARQDLRNAISNQITSQRQLVDLLSLPPGVNVTAADPVEIAGRWQLSLAESVTLAYQNRAELEQQLVQREVDRQQRRVARASNRPQLSLSAQYQLQDNLDKTRSESSDDNDSFAISAQLSWQLFDGGASRAASRQEGIAIEIAETTFADTRESIRFEVEQAFFGIESNLENIETAQAAVQLAEESLRLARLRFQAGVGIQSDVIQAQTDLTEAEANLVTAILGYNRALVSIQRAVSNLPDNNLSDIPPGNI